MENFTFSPEGGHGSALVALHQSSKAHLDAFVANESDGWEPVLAMESDLTIWIEVLQAFPEANQYMSAHRDFGLALYSMSTGLYRQAFAGLRSFIEVAFGALHLSSAELERRQWVSGRRDLSWSAIRSIDTGIYSRTYLTEFMPEAIDEAEFFRESLVAAYRRCSEYLHGNVATTALLPSTISYVPGPILEWKAEARAVLLAFHHSIFIRYYTDMGQEMRTRVEPVLEQHLIHLQSVRRALQLPVEES